MGNKSSSSSVVSSTTNRSKIDYLSRSYLLGSEFSEETLRNEMAQSWRKTRKRYKVIEKIGQGGMGSVYSVSSLKNRDKIFALKRVVCQSEEELNSALMEIVVTKTCSHENLVTYEDVFMERDGDSIVLCIVMQLFSSDLKRLLMERVEKKMPLTEVELLYIVNQISSGVAAMHQRNLIHRDLKPANIFIATSDTYPFVTFKVGDFGLTSRKIAENSDSSVCGTRWYMATEVYTKDYSFPVDVFSIGITLLELAMLEPLSMSIGMLQMSDGEDRVHHILREKIRKTGETYSTHFLEMLFRLIKQNPSERLTIEELSEISKRMIGQTMIDESISGTFSFKHSLDHISSRSDNSIASNSDQDTSRIFYEEIGGSLSTVIPTDSTASDLLSGLTIATFQESAKASNAVSERYIQVKQLGNRVFLGLDLNSNTNVIMKRVKLGDDPEHALNELMMITSIKHPHILSLQDSFFTRDVETGMYYLNIIQDWYPGGSLNVLLNKRQSRSQSLTTIEIVTIFHQISSALHHLHSLEIIHRCIQPMTILVDLSGSKIQSQLIEFGLAVMYEDRIDPEQVFKKGSMLTGSTALSPEEIAMDPVAIGYSTDIYSLGITMFRVSCKERFLLATAWGSGKCARDQVIEQRNKSTLTDSLFNLVLQCLADNPAERPSAHSLVSTLGSMLEG